MVKVAVESAKIVVDSVQIRFTRGDVSLKRRDLTLEGAKIVGVCMLLQSCSMLERLDAIIRIMQLPSEHGDFLLLRLCLIRHKRRNRKSAAMLGARVRCEVEAGGKSDIDTILRM